MLKTLNDKITATPMTRIKEPFAIVLLATRDRANNSDGDLIVPKIRQALIHKRMD
jgi:hypothetical protein